VSQASGTEYLFNAHVPARVITSDISAFSDVVDGASKRAKFMSLTRGCLESFLDHAVNSEFAESWEALFTGSIVVAMVQGAHTPV
jgi:hypothetical protein